MKNDSNRRQAIRYVLSACCLLLFFSIGMFAQSIRVKGNVKDATGEPVIGASVLVKGTANGTITDFDGNFELNDVSGSAVIEVTFVGYLPQEVKVSSTPLNIILEEDTKTLDEVVVIGYGVQKKSVVTASIAKVGSDELGKTAPVRVDNALKGLVSGVQVTLASGQPGSGSKIRIRGNGTINNSDPLIRILKTPVLKLTLLQDRLWVMPFEISCIVWHGFFFLGK